MSKVGSEFENSRFVKSLKIRSTFGDQLKATKTEEMAQSCHEKAVNRSYLYTVHGNFRGLSL